MGRNISGKRKHVCKWLLALFVMCLAIPAVRTEAKKVSVPAAVEGMHVQRKGKKAVISWKKAEGAKGYEIWKRTGKKGRYRLWKTQKKTKVTVRAGKRQEYKARAFVKKGGKKSYGAFGKRIFVSKKRSSASQHCFSEWKETKAASCLTEGKKERVCAVCRFAETEKTTALGHTFLAWEETAASCTEEGRKERRCSFCGEQETERTPALGHMFSAWTQKDGYQESVCQRCKETEIKGDHDRDENLVVFETADPVMGSLQGETRQYTADHVKTSAVTAVPALGYEFIGWSSGETAESIVLEVEKDTKVTAQFRLKALELPVMRIETENRENIAEKERYLTCSVSVSNTDAAYVLEDRAGKIRGRGNSTWYFDKKPYKLKFDSKTDLFGNGAAKKWTLIANYYDRSLIRNELALRIGAQFDAIGETTSKVQSVELYLNGVYEGVYLICEQNEVGKTRVDIAKDFTPDPADTGYLIELNDSAVLEEEGVEGRDWFRVDELPYVIKSPDFDKAPSEEVIPQYTAYMQAYLQACADAVRTGDYAQICRYLDVDTFADSYILNELFNTVDVGLSSFFMYKDAGGKLCSGPVWDFDVTCGNWAFNESCSNTELWAKNTNVWYGALLECEEFRQLVSEKLRTYESRIRETIRNTIAGMAEMEQSYLRNFERWQIFGEQIWYEPAEIWNIPTWQGQMAYVEEWLEGSLAYLLSVYGDR